MIILHRIKDDPTSDKLEQKLKDLVLAFKTVHHQSNKNDVSLPYIEDGDSVISDEQEIDDWVQELEAELNWQRSLSGDGCFIDPNTGKVC